MLRLFIGVSKRTREAKFWESSRLPGNVVWKCRRCLRVCRLCLPVTVLVDAVAVSVLLAVTVCVPPFENAVEEYVTVDVEVPVVCIVCPLVCGGAVMVDVELAVT